MAPSAKFTPSILPGETLEQLFTGRERQLGDTLDRIKQAIEYRNLSHTLFIGPRGSGKTHLIALIQHRLSSWEGYGTSFCTAWINEDAYLMVNSYEDLAAEIVKGQYLNPVTGEGFTGLTVVLIENLDQILEGIGAQGQRQLRTRIEQNRDLLLVATTTSLTSDLIDQAVPFYGFFAQEKLEPFTVDQAVHMLAKKAQQNGDQTLSVRIGEPDSRARIAATQRITGGQPRILSLLADGLTLDRLEDMIDVLIERLDDLTPLYQEQVRRLAPNEKRTVMAIVNADRAMTVGALSKATGIDSKTMGSTVRDLKNKHWLKPRNGPLTEYLDKRTTYYELAEPLARVYFQIKSSHGEPVRLIVEFLAAWFGQPGLGLSPATLPLSESYVHRAKQLAAAPDYVVRNHLAFGFPTEEHDARSQMQPDLGIIEECFRLDSALADLQKTNSAVALLDLPGSTVDMVEDQLAIRSVSLMRIQAALVATRAGGDSAWLTRALDALDAIAPEEQQTSLIALACIRLLLGQSDVGADSLLTAVQLGSHLSAEHVDLVITTLAAELFPESGEFCIDLLNELLPYAVDTPFLSLRRTIGYWLAVVGRAEEALKINQEVLPDLERGLGSNHRSVLYLRNNIAYCIGEAGDMVSALQLFQELLPEEEDVLGPNNLNTLVTRSNIAYLTGEIGHLEKAIQLYRELCADRRTWFGLCDPGTLNAQYYVAYYTEKAGQPQDALFLYQELLPCAQKTLGAEDMLTLLVLGGIARLTDLADGASVSA